MCITRFYANVDAREHVKCDLNVRTKLHYYVFVCISSYRIYRLVTLIKPRWLGYCLTDCYIDTYILLHLFPLIRMNSQI